MNTITAIKPLVIVTLKGKGAVARTAAFIDIAPYAYSEAKSRVASIANLRVALGNAPTPSHIATAQREWVIGRVAARLADSDCQPGKTDAPSRLTHARELVCNYAAPAQDGVKANKLRKGQTGRRTVAQHKVVRAAVEAWSQIKAELGLGKAQTQDTRNAAKKAKRAPTMVGLTGRGAQPAAPTHTQLVTPPKALNADDACQHIVLQAAALLAFCNKNAKLVPAGLGTVVREFKAATDKEEALRQSLAK